MINSFDALGEKCYNQAICGKKCFFEISGIYSNIKLCYFDDFGFDVKSGQWVRENTTTGILEKIK
jgi:hypothetical protein